MSNPFVDLQERLAALLRAHEYFAALPADAILTEKIGDIDSKVVNDLLPLGFGVAITTAKGDGTGSLGTLRSRETITVALIHNPTMEPGKNVLDALFAAITAIQGKPIFANTRVLHERDTWQCISHERRTDAPAELHVHHLVCTASVQLV